MKGAKFSAHAELVHSVAAQLPSDAARMQVLASPVDSSWRRCLNDFNLDPARHYEPEVLDHSRLKQRHAELEDLVQIARVEMDSLYEQISGSGFALLLADTEGVILLERVDPTLKRHFADAGLVVGANWSERCEGTNGIGTCVTEARPITIYRDDHFRACHVGLSCSAAPIRDPYGQVIAVLDASTVNTSGGREAQLHTVALVNLSARLIEKCLFLRHHHSDALLRFHHRPEFVDLLHDGAIAVSTDGFIVGTDITGIKLLGAEHRRDLVGRSIAEVFDTSYGELRALAQSGYRTMRELRDIRFGRRYFASLAEAGQQHSRVALPAQVGPRIVRIASERSGPLDLDELAGDDPQMLRNLRNAQRVAECSVSVVVCGPTGSGKEAFAKAMHFASSRSKQSFVAVNCAAIPETLIEAELFGYASGAFTGARREGMRGRILQSSGGTLFLDEIGDMPLLMQTRLLRVLEEQEVTPLGSEVTHKVDLRVICASHRELRELVQRGEFREDLYYRLNGITLDLPPLVARRDKETLIKKCLAREFKDGPLVSIEARALERLCSYAWPGNIRELRNAIRAALAICEDRIIRMGDLPIVIQQFRPVGVAATAALPLASPVALETGAISLESAEREALLRCIEQHRGNMTVVAAHLGISRNTLYRKIHRHGIQISRRADQTQA